MEKDKITYAEAASLPDDAFDRFYHEVLERSFPPAELEDIQTVRETYHQPGSRVPSLIALCAGEAIGGALGEYYAQGNVVLLAYLAMRADRRGKRLGAALLGRALAEWQESVAPTAMVAEVEDPRHHTTDPYMDSAARLRFYERAGAKLVPIDYFQPSLGHGAPRVRGMFLLCLDSWRQTVPRDAILAFLDEYMELAEGVQARLADPEYLALRAQVESQPDDIPLWPLSRAGEANWLPCFSTGAKLWELLINLLIWLVWLIWPEIGFKNVSDHQRRRPLARRMFRGVASSRRQLISIIAIMGAAATVIALPASDNDLKIGLGSGVAGVIVLAFAGDFILRRSSTLDPEEHHKAIVRQLQRKVERMAEDGKADRVVKRPKDFESVSQLLEDLQEALDHDDRFCAIRVSAESDAYKLMRSGTEAVVREVEFLGCQLLLTQMAHQLAQAPSLGRLGAGTAVDLHERVARSFRTVVISPAAPDGAGQDGAGQSDGDPFRAAMSRLRQEAVDGLEEVATRRKPRLAVLADIRAEILSRPLGNWLRELLDDLRCPYLLVEDPVAAPDKAIERPLNFNRVQSYVSQLLIPFLDDADVSALCLPLYRATGGDWRLIGIRCAVLAAAAGFADKDDRAVPIRELTEPRAGLPLSPMAQELAAASSFRWLVDRKASLVAGRTVTGVFDRLAVIGAVTADMFADLMRDLGLGERQAADLRAWLLCLELLPAREAREAAEGLRLSKRLCTAGVKLLEEQPQAYQDAQAAAEHSYRTLVMNQDAPATPGYAGFDRYEDPGWTEQITAWIGHAREITDPERRTAASRAFICLFLEAWWWWGDQLRLPFVSKLLALSEELFRHAPEWPRMLTRFDSNYQPAWDLRDSDPGRWNNVGSVLDSICASLGLAAPAVPDDAVLRRIYACVCFFRGDVAQYTGRPEEADEWFRRVDEACGNDAMHAFARYQRADVWTTADPARCERLIEELGVLDRAELLDDQSLRGYVARMYGDIRWASGDLEGSFDAYGRAVLLGYIYQVDQESPTMPPSEYSYALYHEMRTRLSRRLDEARANGHADEADAARQRISTLFGPYWAHLAQSGRSAPVAGDDPLAGVAPPLPDKGDLYELGSDYAKDARLMLTDKLATQVAESVLRPLASAHRQRS